MRRLLTSAALALAMALPAALPAPEGAAAQELAQLVADRVQLVQGGALVAQGGVEVLYEGTRLKAARITYYPRPERLEIDGPITLTEGERVVILASAAELDADLRNGILTSARLVLDRQLQLAANQIARVDGRYTLLSKSVASSCQICPADPVPTWEIRAERILHDEVEQQLYFQNASFRLGGVPLLWFPRLRLPDPANTRATGFLLPRVRSTSQLKAGVKFPYFIAIGPHADLTFTPYLSPATRTIEGRWRQAFRSGRVAFEGAVSEDDLMLGEQRYYLFGDGSFALPRGFDLSFDLELVSDPAYLLDYGYSDQDRLASELAITRARRKDLFRAAYTDFRTLRDSEILIEDQLPDQYAVVEYERRIDLMGGELRLGVDAASLSRASTAPGAGRDTDMLGVSADWRGQTILPSGIVAEAQLGFSATSYAVNQAGATLDPATGQFTPRTALTFRWPMQKTGSGGAYHLLEPVMQLAWSRTEGNEVPNEDSVLVEFDEGNLFDLSRFPGEDAQEQGSRLNLGVRYTRYDPAGWSLDLAGGRVFREDPDQGFVPGTGLDGNRSDWLAAVQLRMDNDLLLQNRSIFDDDFSFTKNETRIAYRDDRAAVAATYLWMTAEPQENRLAATHELGLDAAYRITRHWTGKLDGRYDLTDDRTAQAGLGLEYRSECLTVDVSLSRRFTSSTNLSPSTDFGFELSLAGFGSGQNAAYRRRCHY